MTTTKQNATIYSGDSKTLQFTVVDSDGDAKNLTGAEAVSWKLATRSSDGTDVIEKTLGAGVTLTDATNGVLEVALDPADTASLAGTYYQELEITDSGSDVATAALGYITIKHDLN